ncbi:MAG: Ig-like domain-containing protein [Ignavibacteriaceae bacterium]|nr:Ig-like domain-containing protein [Ignavibacteriaceae bacterium]
MAGFFKNYSIAVILLFITGCANMQPPDGGEVDRIPPEVVDVTPANGTTLFKGQEIELKFSEYVDKRTFKDAVFISPALEKGFEVEWSGKTATIIFNEELKPDVTYNITIGTSVIDINNSNNMAKAYSYAISTGDVLDKGTIQGRIYDKDPNKVFVFAYRLGNPEDSLLKRKPDYVTQVGPSGEYILSGLAQGDYRLFAVGNSFGDLIYNLNTDRIGILNRDVTLAQNDRQKGVWIFN